MGWNLQSQDANIGLSLGGAATAATNGVTNSSAALTSSNSGLSSATGSAMAGYQGQAQAGMDISNVNESNYNQQMGVIGAGIGALGSLAGSAAGAYGAMNAGTSDRRLKTDIVPVGKLDNCLTVYRYRFKSGGTYQLGVMADEVERVKPEAVAKGAVNGYDGVYYDRL
jgi:hypothetical protein